MSTLKAALGAALAASALAASVAAAQATAPPPPKEPADVPAVRWDRSVFIKRHNGFLMDIGDENGQVGLLFIGDSITDGWRGKDARPLFEKNYGSMSPLNLGLAGDRTQHVLWRLDNGEIDGISPLAAVLLIGTNNLDENSSDEIASGIAKIVRKLNEKLPHTKVLLLGIFPRDARPDAKRRWKIKQVNARIAKLDDGGKRVKYLDLAPAFLEPDGSLSKHVMPDYVHPNAEGYRSWAEAMAPALAELISVQRPGKWTAVDPDTLLPVPTR